jgi:hypothetical protein
MHAGRIHPCAFVKAICLGAHGCVCLSVCLSHVRMHLYAYFFLSLSPPHLSLCRHGWRGGRARSLACSRTHPQRLQTHRAPALSSRSVTHGRCRPLLLRLLPQCRSPWTMPRAHAPAWWPVALARRSIQATAARAAVRLAVLAAAAALVVVVGRGWGRGRGRGRCACGRSTSKG